MEDNTKKKLEAAVVACADKAEKSKLAIDALQFTQAAVNAANALICLASFDRRD